VLFVDPVGAGTVAIDHDVPFHCSTSGTVAVAVVADPTATQFVLLVHVTPENWEAVEEDGSGGLAVDHAVPFHCSIRSALFASPTAAQNVVPTHDTPDRFAPLGAAGVVTGVQVVPLNCRTSVALDAVVLPVATQKEALVQDTALRRFVPDGSAAMAVLCVHVVAFTVGGAVMLPAADAAGASPTRTPQRALARKTVKTAVRRMQAPP
jgi:hypothetical protein